MKVSSPKSYLLMSGNKKATANFDNNCIESGDKHEHLGITIDSKVTFENHINKFCKKISQECSCSNF